MLSVDDAMTLNNQQQQRPPRPSMGMASSTQKIPPSAKFELASGRVNGMLNRGPLVGTSRVSFGNQANQQGKTSNSSASASTSTPRRLIGGSGYGQTPQRMQRQQQQQQQQQQYQGISSLDPTSAELLETVNSLASEVSAAVGSLYS
jgi:transcription initiation factor TFIID subunit TAF12